MIVHDGQKRVYHRQGTLLGALRVCVLIALCETNGIYDVVPLLPAVRSEGDSHDNRIDISGDVRKTRRVSDERGIQSFVVLVIVK